MPLRLAFFIYFWYLFIGINGLFDLSGFPFQWLTKKRKNLNTNFQALKPLVATTKNDKKWTDSVLQPTAVFHVLCLVYLATSSLPSNLRLEQGFWTSALLTFERDNFWLWRTVLCILRFCNIKTLYSLTPAALPIRVEPYFQMLPNVPCRTKLSWLRTTRQDRCTNEYLNEMGRWWKAEMCQVLQKEKPTPLGKMRKTKEMTADLD